MTADILMTSVKPVYMAAALANLAPNIFGLAEMAACNIVLFLPL
ncbi:hypothetical protein [Arsenophonus endosymbiont of Aleurodicus floccissimus]|nr:hypothetical protein [Arsenophonus endosymbiont of Aleurodicus floccissimus]